MIETSNGKDARKVCMILILQTPTFLCAFDFHKCNVKPDMAETFRAQMLPNLHNIAKDIRPQNLESGQTYGNPLNTLYLSNLLMEANAVVWK
jgi:hypothetical protein